MNRHERARQGQHLINEEMAYADTNKANRDELRSAMRHMSPLGRAIAAAAIRRNNTDSKPTSDPNFHIEAFSYESSNMPYAAD